MGERILILCAGNSCRSQMAEAFLRALDAQLDVVSAGISPASGVHPMAVRVMGELGLDLRNASPKHVDLFLGRRFDYVITVCDRANEACPLFTGSVGARLHYGFDDPASATGTTEEVLAVFRRVRDEIRAVFTQFHAENIKR